MDALKAVVVGTGMMGPGIAVSLAVAGIETSLVSRSAEGAHRGLVQAKDQLGILRDHGLISAEQFSAGILVLAPQSSWTNCCLRPI